MLDLNIHTGKQFFQNKVERYSLDAETKAFLEALFSKTALSWKQASNLHKLLNHLEAEQAQ